MFDPEEATIETSTDVIEEVKAEEHLVRPYPTVTSKPRQEGYEPNKEQAGEFAVSSTEHESGSSAIHTKDSRKRAAKKEKQTGVRSLLNIFGF